MEFEGEYPYLLQGILKEESPDTDRSIRIYKGSLSYYLSSDHGAAYHGFLTEFRSLPENSPLSDVIHLPQIESWQRDVVMRTLDSNARKGGKTEIADLVESCTPFFLLESLSENPRTQLFKFRKGKVFHYLPLPKKGVYLMPSCE